MSRGTARAHTQAGILETSMFSQQHSAGGFSSVKRASMFEGSISHIVDDPLMMRGSLNANFRKSEMNRINRDNAKILKQLSQVGPAVGTYDAWRKHEKRHNEVKNHISGNNMPSSRGNEYGREFTQIQVKAPFDASPSIANNKNESFSTAAPQSVGNFFGTTSIGKQYKLPSLNSGVYKITQQHKA